MILLAGGYDKQIDLTPLAQGIVRRAKAAALMGQTADLLACLLEEHAAQDGEPPTSECGSFEDAFRVGGRSIGAGRRRAAFSGMRKLRLVPQLR